MVLTTKEKNWNSRTFFLAGPVILSNISVPLLGAVDTAVIGQLPSPHYLGAVAVGALIFSVIYGSCNFLRMGTTGLTAQSLGAKEPDEVLGWLVRAGFIAMAVGITLIALQGPLIWSSLKVIDPSSNVAPLTVNYFSIRIWGAPMALFNFAILGWFFGIQNTRAALTTQVFMNGINIILDLWFVLGLDWGVEGVAWATLISEFCGICLGLWIVSINIKKIGGRLHGSLIIKDARIARMIKVNSDILVRSLCLQATFVILTSISARMGDLTLAVNAVLLNFQVFSAYALDGFANAAEAFTGEAIGAKDKNCFRASIRASSLFALVFSCGFTAIYWLAGPFLIDILTTIEEVRMTARIYLPWMVALPMISVWSFQLDGIFIGSTWTTEMRNGMLISLAVFIVSLYLIIPSMGNHGLWLAFSIFMVVRALTLGLIYPRLERDIDRLK